MERRPLMPSGTKRLVRVLGIASTILLLAWLERRFHVSAVLAPERVDRWLETSGPLAPVAFILVMALAVVISPIPSLPLDILAGRVFGSVIGTVYAAVGGTLGAMAAFLLARLLGRDLLAPFLRGHINFCRRCSDKLLTKVVFLSRLVPFVSFDLVSYGAGLTRISLLKFGVATLLGMLPVTFFYTSFGSAVLENRLVTWLGGLAMVVLFFLLPRWIERYDLFSLRRHFAHQNPSDDHDA